MNIKLHNHVPKRSPSLSTQISRLNHSKTIYRSGVENAVARQNSMSCVTSSIRNNLIGLLPIDSTRKNYVSASSSISYQVMDQLNA